MVELDAAQDERHALLERVRVDADPDSELRPSAWAFTASCATRSRSAGVVTFSSRSSPATTFTRPPAASTSEAQSEPSPAARGAQHVGGERLRRLHRDELVAGRRLDHDAVARRA